MAKPAARKSDTCTGHTMWPPRQSTQGSPDTFINSLPAHRKTDAWMVHCYKQQCHTGILSSGSPTVFVNSLAQGRVGDSVNCGSKVAKGSPDTFVGENIVSGPCTNAPPGTTGTGDSIDPNVPTIDGIPVGEDGSKGGTVPYYGSPGGGGPIGGSSGSGGAYANAGSQYATGTNYVPKAANTNVAKGLGSASAKYESNGNPGAIGYDKTGGYSYGEYQIATNTGTMNNYMESLKTSDPDAYAKLQAAGGVDAAKAGTPEFQSAWKDLAANDPNFEASQHSFIQSTHYDVAAANIQNSTGLDISTRSKAVQDAVWSTSVQNGPNSSVFTNALAGKDVKNMSDAQIVNAIYDERGATTSSGSLKYFGKSSQSVQNSVKNRFANERQDVLAEIPS